MTWYKILLGSLGLTGVAVGAVAAYAIFVLGAKWRDFRFLRLGIQTKMAVNSAVSKNETVVDLFRRAVKKFGADKTAIIYIDTGETWTWGMLDQLSNKVALYLTTTGLKAGDTMALYMFNRPEYLCMWLGAAKIGVKTALINYNLKEKSLLHSIRVCDAKLIIYDSQLQQGVADIASDLSDVKLVCYTTDLNSNLLEGASDMNKLLEILSNRELQRVDHSTKTKDAVLYVYTSGTTGLPKAAIVTHFRFLLGSIGFATMNEIQQNDRIFCPLPLYHSSAGILGIGMMMTRGATLLLRSKFSASQFSAECHKYQATVMQYIGELCRFILAQPEKETDKQLCLRRCIGNGLRPEIWTQFQERFNIPVMSEFYSSTEGAGSLLNIDGHPGAIGFISVLTESLMGSKIMRYDTEKDELVRDPNTGLCIPCGVDEPGEFLAEIKTEKNGVKNYDGYQNSTATNKKIVNDVCVQGDRYFRSGDLMKKDADGYVYFVDRIGDTFRWKGENVSTNEVANVLNSCHELNDANVYGVAIPNTDGRAGMACFSDVNPTDVNFSAVFEVVTKELPSYARPIFLRFPQMKTEMTSTFKHKKNILRDEGFDVRKISDPIFIIDAKNKTYSLLTVDMCQDIEQGTLRL